MPGWSPLFQHCAIRVADMAAAMARLDRVGGWRPISTDGPQTLPPNTGGVTAFKFRDPDGHPLELLAFPDRRDGPLFAGIDHSAISVADVGRSIAFYEALGLRVAGRSLNAGIEQSRLDAIDGATVDVVSLALPSGTPPHVELLGYRGAFDRAAWPPVAIDDVVSTALVFESGRSTAATLRDPDGHVLVVRRLIAARRPAGRADRVAASAGRGVVLAAANRSKRSRQPASIASSRPTMRFTRSWRTSPLGTGPRSTKNRVAFQIHQFWLVA